MPAAADTRKSIRPGSANALALMWKTVSTDCNIACDYCYYSTCDGSPRMAARNRIDPALLEKAIREYMAGSSGAVGFAWQGGEPLLAGLPFFERVVALQAQYAPPNTLIGNAIQTNGTLLNDEWARFFKRYNFLVGVSVDGPKDIHDVHRVTATGKGTHDLVMRKIGHLRHHDVDFNILTVLHQGNVRRPRALMEFYERERFAYVQFIPGMDFAAQSPETPARYLVTPGQYGEFLCEVFDMWYGDGSPRMSIRFFDDLLGVYAGRVAGACKHQRDCSRTLVLEQNGDVYPCDFYMGQQWKIGNLADDHLDQVAASAAYRRFAALKGRLPEQCRKCADLDLCHGGCPRDRGWDDAGKPIAADYFCAAHRQLFAHAHDRLTRLARNLRSRWLADHARSGAPWPERNDACVCGSGKKFKRCCGPLRDNVIPDSAGPRHSP